MSTFDLSTVKFVKEVMSTNDVNQALNQGWVLLNLYGDPRQGVTHYSLGWTGTGAPPS